MKYLFKTNWRFYDLLALLIIVAGLFRYSANARSTGNSSANIPNSSSMLEMRTTSGNVAAGICNFLQAYEKIKMEPVNFSKLELRAGE